MRDSFPPADADTELPILPLRNSVLFPASVVPVNVGRPRSVRLIEEAFGADRPIIGVVSQQNSNAEDPEFDEIAEVGTIARVLKVIRLSSGNYSVVLQGVARMRITEPLSKHPCLRARIRRIHETPQRDVEIDALAAHLREAARQLGAHISGTTREGSGFNLDNVQDPGALADLVTSNLPLDTEIKQRILEMLDVRDRLRAVLEHVGRQREVHRMKKEIATMVQEEMSKSQREYLLRQQMRTIRRELGEGEDDEDDVEALRDRLARADLPIEAEKVAKKQLQRMSTMSPAGSEYHTTRQYVEWLADLPWSKETPDRLDVAEARRVLGEDHHGLEHAKKRILEFIAVRKLRVDRRGPIICFVGPPGVGKTSLGRSIARATGREFVRIALGGVQDEAEVRGHRRTYVGAFPGRLLGALKRAGSKNPVIMLDEVDKLGRDNRGDPGNALLEVLDPEQNKEFVDHYLEVPFDLSRVLFIATANSLDTIPGPLLDRMEVIKISGYTRDEKLDIAKNFLIPKQLVEHGMSPERLEFLDPAVERLVDEYTREAGVRLLEQRVAALCRAVAVRFAQGEDVQVSADGEFVEEVLGPPRHERQLPPRSAEPGFATGLAWTAGGGDLMFVEASRMPGKGRVHTTGSLGDILKESAATAFTIIRSKASQLGLPDDFLTKVDVHLHFPQGAVPKDGAAAGIPIFVALASMLTRIRARPDVGMSGEITLRGAVLEVSGIKEKCLTAHRAGIREIILPKRNLHDLDDIPENIRKDLKIHLVSRVEEVLPLVLEMDPVAHPPVAAPPPAP
ncbi:MAG: endopeptidase La [Myxococcales bacterium]|nr:endopeptidase La [Myxococcales bacterium]